MIQSIRYILLEDERITALGLKRMVARLRPDWSLLGESDSAADIPRLVSLTPDLIMSDVYLADGTSTDFLHVHAADIPVILFSGYPDAHHHVHHVSNLVACLYKPVSHSDLASTIASFEAI